MSATSGRSAEIGAELKRQAIMRGRSVASLATVLGLSRSAVRSRISGETPILLKEVCAIAPHLGMDAVSLLVALQPETMGGQR